MWTALGLATVAMLASGPPDTAAQQQDPAPRPPAQRENDRRTAPAPKLDGAGDASKDPFSRLFVQDRNRTPLYPEPDVVRAREIDPRRIVCGMTVIQADPSVDPKMVIPAPPNSDQFRIRRITPPVCVE
jgi:hypothetical protein